MGSESAGQDDGPPPRQFSLAVDSENKAMELRLLSFAAPHMRTFHLSWFSFFSCFVSTFAAAPLLPVIRDNLNLTSTDIGNAGIASVSGAVAARLVMGSACDLVGPRLASSSLILATSPAVYFTACIDSPASFFMVRFLSGFSLASFVSCQFWMSSMFSSTKVGIANGVAAGWGNLGGGATQLLMPLVFDLILLTGSSRFTAWRIAFFIPAMIQTGSAIAVMILGQDLPDGNFRELLQSGEKAKDSFSKVVAAAAGNYRAWIAALCYGYCFGVELAIDNIIAEYFYDKFDLNLQTAGIVAASFGLANFVSRPGGGFLSDVLAARYGMRGRLWGWWVVQTLGGVLCIWLGKTSSLNLAILVMILFSVFVQAACGLTFGVIPFISRRSLGMVLGMTGGGGNLGAVVTQLLFFKGTKYSKEEGITYMGMMILCCTIPIMFIYFPMWGGMLRGALAEEEASEEKYYAAEWSAEEKARGLHLNTIKFADNCRGERGRGRPIAVPIGPPGEQDHLAPLISV